MKAPKRNYDDIKFYVFLAVLITVLSVYASKRFTSKTNLERQRDSVERVYKSWKKNQNIKKEIQYMENEMYGDSIRKHTLYELERRIDSLIKHKKGGK